MWGLDRIDQSNCVHCENEHVPNGTKSSVNGSTNRYHYDWDGTGVTAYVIDSGIQALHNEFTGTQYVAGDDGGSMMTTKITSRASCLKNFRQDLSESCEMGWGHGTHVASIIGGRLYGVAKNVTLVSIKVFGNDGTSRFSDIIAGIETVVGERVRYPDRPMVINLSLGTSEVSPMINAAVDGAVSLGIPVVVAAGNGHVDACTYSPASAAGAITVAASTTDE
jgi:serine protease